MSDSQSEFLRPIRSFVKREGKLTRGQQNAIDDLWDDFGVDLADGELDFNDLFSRDAETILEIGFGNGMSLADMAETSPDQNYFGIEGSPSWVWGIQALVLIVWMLGYRMMLKQKWVDKLIIPAA